MSNRPKIHQIFTTLYEPMDIAGLAVIRMLFGAIIMVEAWRYTDEGRLYFNFIQPIFHFKYRFFEWVPAASMSQMKWIFYIYGAAGLLIFLGLFYRLATATAALCISYIFLNEATNYLNHFYLVIIFS